MWPEINPSKFTAILAVPGIGAIRCEHEGGKILLGFDSRIKAGTKATLDGKTVTIKSATDPRDDDHAGAWMILEVE